MSINVDSMPQDVREALPEEARNLFIAAYNSALDNSGNEESAMRIAWQTIEHNEHYERGQDGKWQRKPDMSAVPRGGVATMPNS